MKHEFDVIVVGAGHAGLEAAAAAVRLGRRVALVTLSRDDLGALSCNPAIGGVGKGHLVREIDALDGLMGRLGDAAAIQYRLLNASKGPAVQGPRTQTDRALYRQAVSGAVSAMSGLTLVEGEVSELVLSGNGVQGVRLADGTVLKARGVVVATGTFLGGVIHIGNDQRPAGRWGGAAADRLRHQFAELGLPKGRLKTGTPPRLDGRTIDWAALPRQEGDAKPVYLSFLTEITANRQIACGVTQTTEHTHDIIRENLGRSALYSGNIEGAGPRYCPSIEDKIVKFPDKSSHQVFLEPEGLDDTTVYPNGVSTSLPDEVQLAYLRSMPGLSSVEMVRPGYAVEYSFVDPRSLRRTLEVAGFDGLFFAGQINGTTGYEEAAAQGLVAGLNAALRAQGRPLFEFGRDQAYIGVMIDDLVSRGATEPYRMFTSRAEYRLSLRADNADMRLTPLGLDLGCVTEARRLSFERKHDEMARGREALRTTRLPAAETENGETPTRPWTTAYEALGQGDGVARVAEHGARPEISQAAWEALCAEACYAPFAERQKKEAEKLAVGRQVSLPPAESLIEIPGLSIELRHKILAVRPATLVDAERIEGMTPAALALLLIQARQKSAA
ncbi:tRNA uridine-5-carboxymethylaminomethyl(34) synthesis enzyme MnmG [Paracoccus sp. S-4012]|uniref:tRNA uridine-5-carboxymethylaminomethyl(34) synthesis enzyme MnmG n=1 Tax=Paracoccus sp. S-4012 TaxID=2665648 RepID=UPI00351B4E70